MIESMMGYTVISYDRLKKKRDIYVPHHNFLSSMLSLFQYFSTDHFKNIIIYYTYCNVLYILIFDVLERNNRFFTYIIFFQTVQEDKVINYVGWQ